MPRARSLDDGEIWFTRNGRSMGTAFKGVPVRQRGLVYFPTISISTGERCIINLGERPWMYPPEDPAYLPIARTQPPTAKFQYLLDCVERLAPALAEGGVDAGGVVQTVVTEHGAMSVATAAVMCLQPVMAELERMIQGPFQHESWLASGPLLTTLLR